MIFFIRINSRFRIQMNYISLKFSSFLFAAYALGLATGGQSPNIGVITDSNGDQIVFLNFMPYLDSVLNVQAIVSKVFAANVEDCHALCMNAPRCLSVNVAILPDDEQRHLCQMLGTTKNSEPDRFGPSKTFHHFNTIVSDRSSDSSVPLLDMQLHQLISKKATRSHFSFYSLLIFAE